MILYLRYCRTGVLFHITVHVKDQYVTTYDDVILVKPNRIWYWVLVHTSLCYCFNLPVSHWSDTRTCDNPHCSTHPSRRHRNRVTH